MVDHVILFTIIGPACWAVFAFWYIRKTYRNRR